MLNSLTLNKRISLFSSLCYAHVHKTDTTYQMFLDHMVKVTLFTGNRKANSL